MEPEDDAPVGAPAAPAENAAPYAEYLERLPEEVRGQVEPVFKEWDGNVTKRFQENAAATARWKPYEDLGVHEIPVAEMEWLTNFRAAQANPQAIAAWFEEYAKANGLTPAEEQQITGDPEIAALIQAELERALGPVSQQLGELSGWRAQQEEQVRLQAATTHIEGQLASLKEKHGDFPREIVEKFIPQYMNDPEHAVERAHADYLALVGQIEKQTLTQKLGQAPGAESGGAAATAPEPIKTLEQASRIALERLRHANAA
jgi:hypothetical protein